MVSAENETNKELVHRLNRLQGQIEAIKRQLENEDSQCMKTMHLLKAANQAFKKFGEAYVSVYFDRCLSKQLSRDELEKEIKEVISSAFVL